MDVCVQAIAFVGSIAIAVSMAFYPIYLIVCLGYVVFEKMYQWYTILYAAYCLLSTIILIKHYQSIYISFSTNIRRDCFWFIFFLLFACIHPFLVSLIICDNITSIQSKNHSNIQNLRYIIQIGSSIDKILKHNTKRLLPTSIDNGFINKQAIIRHQRRLEKYNRILRYFVHTAIIYHFVEIKHKHLNWLSWKHSHNISPATRDNVVQNMNSLCQKIFIHEVLLQKMSDFDHEPSSQSVLIDVVDDADDDDAENGSLKNNDHDNTQQQVSKINHMRMSQNYTSLYAKYAIFWKAMPQVYGLTVVCCIVQGSVYLLCKDRLDAPIGVAFLVFWGIVTLMSITSCEYYRRYFTSMRLLIKNIDPTILRYLLTTDLHEDKNFHYDESTGGDDKNVANKNNGKNAYYCDSKWFEAVFYDKSDPKIEFLIKNVFLLTASESHFCHFINNHCFVNDGKNTSVVEDASDGSCECLISARDVAINNDIAQIILQFCAPTDEEICHTMSYLSL